MAERAGALRGLPRRECAHTALRGAARGGQEVFLWRGSAARCCYWPLAIGHWPLAIGYWRLAIVAVAVAAVVVVVMKCVVLTVCGLALRVGRTGIIHERQ